MNRDFVEMLSALVEARAEFLIVGAHALAAHGVPRATGDLDIWVRCESKNAEIGVPPSRIDILTSISGVSFEQAWPNRMTIRVESLAVAVLGKNDFIANKRAVGRPKDLSDLDLLAETERER